MRTVLGPRIDQFSVARASVLAGVLGLGALDTEPVPVKLDPVPTFQELDPSGEPIPFRFHVPAYETTTHNTLARVTVVVVPAGHGEPDSPDAWLESSYAKGSTDATEVRNADLVVDVPGVEDGTFTAQVLFTYDA